MAFSARAPRSHCAWKPENAEQHLSSPQCQVSVGKRRRWHGMSWIWSSGFLNERRQGLQPSAYGLLVTSYLDLDDSDASLVKRKKKKKKSSLFWIIHACRNIIFTLNNEIPTCMISALAGYCGQASSSLWISCMRTPILTWRDSNSSHWRNVWCVQLITVLPCEVHCI